jgi:hypothetical protein
MMLYKIVPVPRQKPFGNIEIPQIPPLHYKADDRSRKENPRANTPAHGESPKLRIGVRPRQSSVKIENDQFPHAVTISKKPLRDKADFV